MALLSEKQHQNSCVLANLLELIQLFSFSLVFCSSDQIWKIWVGSNVFLYPFLIPLHPEDHHPCSPKGVYPHFDHSLRLLSMRPSKPIKSNHQIAGTLVLCDLLLFWMSKTTEFACDGFHTISNMSDIAFAMGMISYQNYFTSHSGYIYFQWISISLKLKSPLSLSGYTIYRYL